MKFRNASIAMIVALGVSATAMAQCSGYAKTAKADDKKSCTKTCPVTGKSKTCDKSQEMACSGPELKAAGTPLLYMQVGDKRTACPVQAKKLVSDCSDAKVKFVVNDRTYCNKADAFAAYNEVLDKHLAKFTTVNYVVGNENMSCPHAAEAKAKQVGDQVHFRVASFEFGNRAEAAIAAKLASNTANDISIKKIVNGKEVAYDCSKSCAEKCDAKKDCSKPCDSSKDGYAKKASAKKGCDKPCGDKASAQLASNKKGCDKPCDAKKDGYAKKASTKKDCDKPCGDKASAQLASNKKGCDKPCDKAGKDCTMYAIGDFRTCCEATAQIALKQARIVAAHKALQEIANEREIASKGEAIGA